MKGYRGAGFERSCSRSRYNAEGCDLNRDFGEYRTDEARILGELIEKTRPDILVSLHEGPQDGYLLVVTSEGSRGLGESVVEAVRKQGASIAQTHFTGFRLSTPGLSHEGWGADFLKWLLRLRTMGRFANQRGIGVYTAETDWASLDSEQRIQAHVRTVAALLLSPIEGEAP